MGRRALFGPMEPEDDTEHGHKIHPILHVYGSEVVLPTDLEYGSPRLKAYNEQSNKETRENAVDQLEEARDMALLNSARY